MTIPFVRANGGGREDVNTVAATGTTETLNLEDGNVHDVTLDDDCTFTFAGTAADVSCSFTLILRQDGSGGHTPTWPGAVVWADGNAPTVTSDAAAVDVFVFVTRDDGTTWFGFIGGQDFS